MCILPVNIVNEKIYVFTGFGSASLSCVNARQDLVDVLSRASIGDWLIIDLLSQ
ncbi:Structural component of the gap junctions protein [Tyrophagus putrescentiae]|nr:Structural component of the gap junctions protein [Tyrophagus putrescentiae]